MQNKNILKKMIELSSMFPNDKILLISLQQLKQFKKNTYMKKQKKVIYLSGSISNDTNYLSKFNFWKKILKNKFPNAEIASPPDFVVLKNGSEKEKWADAMIQCLNALKVCTDIFIIPETRQSTGRDIEIMFADYLGLNFLSYYDL